MRLAPFLFPLSLLAGLLLGGCRDETVPPPHERRPPVGSPSAPAAPPTTPAIPAPEAPRGSDTPM